MRPGEPERDFSLAADEETVRSGAELRDRRLLRLELPLVELGVQTTHREQLGVGAPLDQPAVVSTRIWSAASTVDSRCAIAMVVRPANSGLRAAHR